MSVGSRLIENLADVRGKIGAAAQRSGRSAREITLVAVTKYVGVDVVPLLIDAGCRDVGESRPQELWAKAEALRGTPDAAFARWHLVGHLQRNKVRRSLPVVSLVHSADSMRLLEEIDRSASELNRRLPVLLEVNVSDDATKHGFEPHEVEPHLPAMGALKSVEVKGLMCMASREGDLDQARREFASLRQLRDRLQGVAPAGIALTELSMGMSGDYEEAIDEGATIVRVGSALFQGISTA